MQQPITREQAKAMVSQKIAIIEKQVAINKACLGPLKHAHHKFSTLCRVQSQWQTSRKWSR